MLVTRYLRWSGLRAASARGWWLVTAVYLVVEADLTPFQLVFIGTAQGLVVVLAEVPAGVFADTVGRRASIVVAHLASGTGMVLVAFVTDYPLVLLSQCLWGVGWAFTSGADVAWITDELGDRSVVDRVLARSARWSLAGGAAGTVVFGLLAGATSLRLAIVCGGSLMLLLGVAVVARFPETAFVPVATSRWRHAASVFSGGVRVARADRAVLAIILATLLVNGGHEGFGRLQDLRLLSLGFAGGDDGSTPVVWFTVLAVVGLLLGAVALRIVERHIDGSGVARRTYALACTIGAVGVAVLAVAPNATWAVVGVLLVRGFGDSIVRPVSGIWINRRTPSSVRATVHSFNSQAENVGEVVCGFGLALLAGATSTTASLVGAAVLTALAGVVVARADDSSTG